MARPIVWYVVMNAHEALILRDLRELHDPEHRETMLGGPAPRLRDMYSDRPTRSFASAGGGRRSAVAPHGDPMRDAARSFLRDVFDYLERRRMAGAFNGLVLIGAPDTVGLWREVMPGALRSCIRREVARNLVNLPGEKLIPAVRALTAERPDV